MRDHQRVARDQPSPDCRVQLFTWQLVPAVMLRPGHTAILASTDSILVGCHQGRIVLARLSHSRFVWTATPPIVDDVNRALPLLTSGDLRATAAFYQRLGFTNKGAPPEEWDYLIIEHDGGELHFVGPSRENGAQAAASSTRTTSTASTRSGSRTPTRRLVSRRSSSRTTACARSRCSTSTTTRFASVPRHVDLSWTTEADLGSPESAFRRAPYPGGRTAPHQLGGPASSRAP